MDPAPGPSGVSATGASESSGKDRITAIYRRFAGVRLTPTKIPNVLDAFDQAENERSDAEEDETESQTEEEEEGAPAPPPLTTRRTRGACTPKIQPSKRHPTRRLKITPFVDSGSDSSFDISGEDEPSDEDEAPQPPRKRTCSVRTRKPGASGGWLEDNVPPVFDDFTGSPGLKITKPTSALAYIQLFITRELIHYLAYETNLYALQLFNLANENVDDIWKPLKLKEMARFLGLCMLMGVTKNPTMRMYWQTNKSWHTRFFDMFMTSRRFQHIGQFFHAFNSNAVPVDNTDKLIKVRPVMDYLRHRFQEVYYPMREFCLDEGTMAWRGRLSFKLYNPSKPDKYGVKFYMLAESTSGYIYSFEVYSGIGRTIIETVTSLMRPLLNKGHHLYMDNYYNSVTLTEKLREVGVYTCGTIRLLRGAPKDLQQLVKSKIDVNTIVYRRKDNTFILLWKDKRVVSMITNLINADTKKVQKRKRVRRADGTLVPFDRNKKRKQELILVHQLLG
ncbi:piggyBac transposable element-derived protein 4-like [Procambarus clarkii]|uniref:piggyBac transposable element-derived protein 4-like n=1 Tax=Procambarus clarkii TaxID=6728 RepID=UPI0037444F73